VKCVMTYYPSEGFLALARQHGDAHRARLQEFHDRGVLLLAGPLDSPPGGEALGIFTSREAAEEFVAGDPFVTRGVVARWTLRPFADFFEAAPPVTAPPGGAAGDGTIR
jgi:uncharacterized protein YciI